MRDVDTTNPSKITPIKFFTWKAKQKSPHNQQERLELVYCLKCHASIVQNPNPFSKVFTTNIWMMIVASDKKSNVLDKGVCDINIILYWNCYGQ